MDGIKAQLRVPQGIASREIRLHKRFFLLCSRSFHFSPAGWILLFGLVGMLFMVGCGSLPSSQASSASTPSRTTAPSSPQPTQPKQVRFASDEAGALFFQLWMQKVRQAEPEEQCMEDIHGSTVCVCRDHTANKRLSMEQMIQFCDTNHDGVLTLNEVRRMKEAF